MTNFTIEIHSVLTSNPAASGSLPWTLPGLCFGSSGPKRKQGHSNQKILLVAIPSFLSQWTFLRGVLLIFFLQSESERTDQLPSFWSFRHGDLPLRTNIGQSQKQSPTQKVSFLFIQFFVTAQMKGLFPYKKHSDLFWAYLRTEHSFVHKLTNWLSKFMFDNKHIS